MRGRGRWTLIGWAVPESSDSLFLNGRRLVGYHPGFFWVGLGEGCLGIIAGAYVLLADQQRPIWE
jgi:hypothetical protein